jgi:hypothetical protein
VVTAEPAVIGQLLEDLNLPEESLVSVSDNTLALAFWGEDLSSYVSWRDASFGSRNGSGRHAKTDGNG